MLKITISEHPYFGHGTTAVHVYDISEGLKTIRYDKYTHELIVEFDSCSDNLILKVGRITNIKIEG